MSRLLELAAAMSSAQEKVTGNGKLDMAGIMAALSLAHQEELSIKETSQAGGQNSFLNGKYQVEHILISFPHVWSNQINGTFY